MPKVYKQKCKYCSNYYEGWGKFYCSNNCKNKDRAENNPLWRKKNRKHLKRIWSNPTENMKKRLAFLKTNPPRKGAKLSKETKKKISIKAKQNFQGKNNPNYKGNKAITPLLTRIRNSAKYKKCRDIVYKRDNYTCQICNRKSKKGDHVDLQAHHIKEFAKIIKKNNIRTFEQAMNCKELWKLKNSITLCIECHKSLHKL